MKIVPSTWASTPKKSQFQLKTLKTLIMAKNYLTHNLEPPTHGRFTRRAALAGLPVSMPETGSPAREEPSERASSPVGDSPPSSPGQIVCPELEPQPSPTTSAAAEEPPSPAPTEFRLVRKVVGHHTTQKGVWTFYAFARTSAQGSRAQPIPVSMVVGSIENQPALRRYWKGLSPTRRKNLLKAFPLLGTLHGFSVGRTGRRRAIGAGVRERV